MSYCFRTPSTYDGLWTLWYKLFLLNASSILLPLSISWTISNSPLAPQDQVHFTSWFIHLSKQTNQNTFTLIDCQGYETHCLLLIWIRVTTLLWTASKLTSGTTSWTILMIISHAHSISAAHATHAAVPPEWTSILTPKCVVMFSITNNVTLSLFLFFFFC